MLTSNSTLRPAEKRQAQKLMIVEGMVWTVMFHSLYGVVLTGWALALGATAWQIGLLNTIPVLVRLVQLFAPRFMRPPKDRKRLALLGLAGARAFNVPMLLLPLAAWLFVGAHPALFWVMLAVIVAYNALDALGVVAWMSWATDVVPVRERGRYWAQRGVMTGLVGLVAAPVVGWVLDAGRGAAQGTPWAGHPHPLIFALLFAVGTLAGGVTAWLLARTPHAPLVAATPPDEGLFQPVRRALADPLLRRYVTARSIWSFAINLGLPFVSVYMLTNLRLDFTTVTLLGAGQTLLLLGSLSAWGRAVDRWGCLPVVMISTSLRAASMLLLALVAPGTPGFWPLLVLYVVTAGLGDAGLQLSIGNLLMKLAPRADPAYFAAFNTLTGLMGALAPLLASVLLAVVGSGTLVLAGLPISPLQVFFALALLGAVGSLVTLLGFREPADVADPAPASA